MSDRAQANGNPHAAAPLVREVEIINKKGLHARASAKFVQTAEQFEGTEITVTRVHDSGAHETVGGTSIMGLMMLAAGPGVTITIAASGPDAAAALDALCALVASRFGEDD